MRTKPIQRSFDGGAWGEELIGRSDHPSYGSAARQLRNFIPRVTGSAPRRPGTLYIASTKNPTEPVRLIPLIFDTENAYVIELGHLYARFYKQDAQIINLGVPVEIVTPWTQDELFDLQWAHDADTLVIVHPNHQPRLLQRASDISWLISTLDFTYGPYLNRNEIAPNVFARQTGTQFAAKLNVSGADASYRGAASSRTVAADGDVFDETRDIGRLIVVGDGETTGAESFAVGEITAVASSISATVNFFDGRHETGAGPNATASWYMQAYYEGTDQKRWPTCCTFFQQRLWLGGGETGQDLLYASRIGAIDDFDLWSYYDLDPPASGTNEAQHTILDSSGISLELSYPEVHRLRWLRGSRSTLVAGTSRAVFVIQAPNDEGFTPLNALKPNPTAAAGSHTLAAVALNERLHFVAASRARVTRIAFSLEADAFVPADMTLFNPAILQPGVRDFAVAYTPDPILWCALDDGRLAGCTLDEGQRVIAWHDHVLGGRGVEQDYAEVESVTVIPSSDLRYDQLWMVVRRTVDGVEARFVERMDPLLLETDTILDQRLVDARGPAYSGAATTTYAVGTHLVGETVDVLADGGAEAPRVVNVSGEITLGVAASDIVAGLPQVSRFVGMPLVVQTRDGISLGDTLRAGEIILVLIRSLGGRVGVGPKTGARLNAIAYRQNQDTLGAPPPLFTGILRQPGLDQPDMEVRFELEVSGPLNFEMAAIGVLPDTSSS